MVNTIGIVAVAAFAASAEEFPAGRGEHRNLMGHQFGSHRRQLIVPSFRPAILDRDILALEIASFSQTLSKCSES